MKKKTKKRSFKPEVEENPPSLETQQNEEQRQIELLLRLEGYVLQNKKRFLTLRITNICIKNIKSE